MVIYGYTCRKAGPLIRQANGPPPTRGSLNMEVSKMMMVLVTMFITVEHNDDGDGAGVAGDSSMCRGL